MRYLVLVSHAELAPGVHSVLKMLGLDNDQVKSVNLADGEGADLFAEKFKAALAGLSAQDEVILLGDIVGGSPTTTSLNCLQELGLLANCRAFVGLNLPMAVCAVSNLDAPSLDAAVQDLLDEAKAAMMDVSPRFEESGEEDDI